MRNLLIKLAFIGAVVVLAGSSSAQENSVQHIKLDTLAAKQMNSLITRRMSSGSNATFGYFEMQKGAVVPLHQHVNEQYTFILKGSVKVTIQSITYIVKAGEAILIPANVPHLFECLEDGTVDLDFFAPKREDWINGTDNYFKQPAK